MEKQYKVVTVDKITQYEGTYNECLAYLHAYADAWNDARYTDGKDQDDYFVDDDDALYESVLDKSYLRMKIRPSLNSFMFGDDMYMTLAAHIENDKVVFSIIEDVGTRKVKLPVEQVEELQKYLEEFVEFIKEEGENQ